MAVNTAVNEISKATNNAYEHKQLAQLCGRTTNSSVTYRLEVTMKFSPDIELKYQCHAPSNKVLSIVLKEGGGIKKELLYHYS